MNLRYSSNSSSSINSSSSSSSSTSSSLYTNFTNSTSTSSTTSLLVGESHHSISDSRPRRLRVVTAQRRSNKMLRTRSLSELVFMQSPRNSPRVTPRHGRFDMDIEVSSTFANGEGTVDILSTGDQLNVVRPDYDMGTTDLNLEDLVKEDDIHDLRNETRPGRPTDVSSVIDMLFEIHSALKTRHLGNRTAASALAASNLVSTVAFPAPAPMSRDEQIETLENTRKMLECAICQDVYSEATEATCCGQVFCKECIERWVNERGSCPMCRDNLAFNMLMPNRHSQRMANEMTVNCNFCQISSKKADLAEHVAICPKRPLEPPPPQDVLVRRSLLARARGDAISMRSFLCRPSPCEADMTQCYIRTRGGDYELYTMENDVLLLTANRRRQLDMSVTFVLNMTFDQEPGSRVSAERQIGRLERNFVGSQYTMYAIGEVAGSDQACVEIGAVQYAATFGKTPRQMRVAVPAVVEEDGEWCCKFLENTGRDDTMLAQIERPDPSRSFSMMNKPPVWIESLEAYCLDFGGRVAAASVKNFLLSHPDDMDTTLMLFGRTADRNVYSMDYRHPLTPLQAFSIALSSMDSHLVTFD